ncbi:MAG: LamG domain-containing protein, partial [bacterium]|nr:LamG domain-containing protein [bacterium]
MTTTNLKTLQLDGQSGYAALAPASDLGLYDGDFTVEAWISIDAWGTDYLPVLGTAATAAQQGLHLAVYERRPYLGFYQADTAGCSELELATWYHLAWRYTKEGGEQAIFLNGVLDASTTGNGAFLGTDTVWIGRYADANFFKGRIAELRIWRTARPAAEILAGMHQRLAGDEPDLVGVWPLDDGEGQSAGNAKASLQGENLGAVPRLLPAPPSTHAVRFDGITGCVEVPAHTSLEGLNYTCEAWIRPEGPPPRNWASVLGPCRQVMEFDGVGDYVAVEGLHYDTAGAIEAITVEAWIRTSNNTGECCIASWDRSEYWRLSVGFGSNPGRIYWGTADQASVVDDMIGDVNVADGEWHFIAVTYDRAASTKTIYVDGELDRSVSAHAGEALGTGLTRYGFIGECSEADTFDGKVNDYYYFDGQMAEMRIWDHARTETEIRQDMDRRLSGEEAGLVACWALGHLDHQGDTWDLGPNGYRGASRGGVAVVDAGAFPLLDGDSGLLLSQDGALRHRYLSDSGVDGPDDVVAGSVPWNLWRHVAITNDGTTARTLIDGEVVSEAPVTALTPRSGGLHLGEHLRGTVAEVRVWNVARTPEE